MHDVGKHYPKYSLFPDKPEVSNPIYDFVMYEILVFAKPQLSLQPIKLLGLILALTMVANTIRTISGSTALELYSPKWQSCAFPNSRIAIRSNFDYADALKHIFKETASNWILIMHNNSMLMYETNMSIFHVAD